MAWRFRPRAKPWRAIGQIRSKQSTAAAAMHVPILVEDQFRGVVYLVRRSTVPFLPLRLLRPCLSVNAVEKNEIAPEGLDFAQAKRAELIEQLAEVLSCILWLSDQEYRRSTCEDAFYAHSHLRCKPVGANDS
ncbi:hypothetical protein JAAARDRAFT_254780 [Jaapia argillacea MUCL 33604]|uniref:Uncharacterized protein n=1 Tax=Jaapia argillacea MUCL 33604 TaxID=933084 RepID=A0A067PVX4_9AGAM|nr:hypothetical protein JAAARDRAFT_254780 [Jaapia argillacea MUCL 33604]